MITVTVQNHNHFAALTFPCSEREMEKALEELDRWDETNFTLFVDKVSEPEELSVLQDRFVGLFLFSKKVNQEVSYDKLFISAESEGYGKPLALGAA